jgi:hypothetical protein
MAIEPPFRGQTLRIDGFDCRFVRHATVTATEGAREAVTFAVPVVGCTRKLWRPLLLEGKREEQE